MAKIIVNNPRQVINGGAKKYYFKVKGLGGPKGDKGDKGDTGSQGPQGPQGNAATISVGSTTTLAVGQDATVENVGSIYNAVLNFGIPQGPRGPQGATGAKGDKGDKGDQGNPGPQGEKGTNATVYVGTTTTLNPGSQATVYNSGTDSNAVLNFGIPKGEKGDTGPMPTIAQTTGQAIDQVMSQKATTDALNTKQATITNSNKLSADLVTDTTTTNKFVTAEDKTAWNEKQDALTAGNNIDITDDVISTPAIAPEVVAELPATGAEGKLYLTPKNYTRGTGTGNPIEATITAQAGQLESFQLDGDTFQQTYTGKNLLMNKASAQEKTGVTITPNSDGGFTLNGTATTTTDFYFVGSWSNRTISYLYMPSGDYTISLLDSDKQQIASPKFRIELYDRMGENSARVLWLYGASSPQTTTLESSAQVTAYYISIPINQSFTNEKFYIQLEKGSTATSYEPFVGGQPSPNPSYPQLIQTVTGEQMVTVVGKNLFDGTWRKGQYDNGAWHPDSFDGERATTNLIPVTGGDYSISLNSDTLYTSFININYFDADKNWLGNRTTLGLDAFSDTDRTKSFTLPDTAYYLAVSIRPYHGYSGQTVYANAPSQMLQVERASSVTAYTPYSKQTYPINLGSIELCKLGGYQDYIWKDGDDWKVHKATASDIMESTDNWVIPNPSSYPNLFQSVVNRLNLAPEYALNSSALEAFCEKLTYIDSGAVRTAQGFAVYNNEGSKLVRINIANFTTVAQLKGWLDNNNVKILFALATPTDTTITDTDLIAQLEAIRTASLENGTNTITNTATGTNLAGDMEIGYYGYNPTNRYDKWLWLDINNEYEQIGS